MKVIQNTLFRALCAIALGVLLLVEPEHAASWVVMGIGGLFVLSSFIGFSLVFWRKSKDGGFVFLPLSGIGSLLMGLLLIFTPLFFVKALMIVLGVVLMIAGLVQMIGLSHIGRFASVGLGMYLMPLLIFLTGGFIIAQPVENNILFTVAAVTSIIYGVNELINAFQFRKVRKTMMAGKEVEVEDAQIIED